MFRSQELSLARSAGAGPVSTATASAEVSKEMT